jgi:hypothetical protein
LATGPSFPETVPIDPPAPPGEEVAVFAPVTLDLFVGVSLSDDAVAGGPAANLTLAFVGYQAVPEPGLLVLGSIGTLLMGLRLGWHRRKRVA